ncbi:MAG: hypothetical protein Q9198_000124 [Flavoplaca austrocitrina]
MTEATMLAEATGPPLTVRPSTPARILMETTNLWPENLAFVSVYQNAARYDEQPTTDGHLAWTYRELDQKSDELAASLAVAGISSGMRLAVFLPNSAEWAVLFWASVKLGTTFVPLDERAVSRTDEVAHYLSVLNLSALFVLNAAHAHILLEQHPLEMNAIAIKAVTDPDSPQVDGWRTLKELFAHGDLNPTTNKPLDCSNDRSHSQEGGELDSILYIIFTSGISGQPKACPVSSRNVWASVMAGEGLDHGDHTDVMLMNTPPSHSMGIAGILRTWFKGATVVIPSPAFDAKMTIETIDKLKSIPTMILALLRQPIFHPEKTRSLRKVILGGTIVSPSIAAATTNPELLGASEAIAGFGMSEGLPICSSSSKQEMKVDRGALSLGKALPGVRIRVCHHGSRQVLRRGEIGELHFGGGMVIAGYLFGDNRCFYDDDFGHWIVTGDEAMMDQEGNIFIFGRYKDIIIRGGKNLSPALIENCLGKAGILGQIIGVPDEFAGEIPLAIVQAPNQEHIPKAKILDLVMESLGPACLPTTYITLAELGMASFPLTTSGKVRKSELRKAALEYLAGQTIKDHPASVNGSAPQPNTSIVTLVRNIVAEITGQPGHSILPDQPISTLLDSINILRLHAKIQRTMMQKVSIELLLGEATVNTMAKYVDATPKAKADTSYAPPKRQRRPPTASDMVHTHDDTRCESRTRAQAQPLLAKHGMSWEDVEQVLPIPDSPRQAFEAMRPLSFSVRMVFAIKSTSNFVLRNALETTLEKWSIFRSLAMNFDDTPLFVIPRACKAILQESIIELPDTEDLEQMRGLLFPEANDNNVHLGGGGLLARFGITHIKSTKTTGLMILANHSLFDAISIQGFNQDLEANISGGHASGPWTDYKLFADIFYQNRTSIPAQTSVAYHVNRLRGIGPLREVVWPAQRCLGWFIGNDTGYHIPQPLRNPLLSDRSQIDNDAGYTGMVGIKKMVNLEDLAQLRSERGISTPVFFKLACAILNSHLSGSSEVCFAQSQAGRQWPFVDETIGHCLPNPVTIAGNTLALILNRIHVNTDAQVGRLLTHLEEEQRLLTKHAHAPIAAISAQLNTADAVSLHAGQRQLLNWNPFMAENVAKRESARWELLQLHGFTDIMLEWHCGVVGSNAVLITCWDGAQFGQATVEMWADMFISALKWVATMMNWDRKLGEVDLEIPDCKE